MKRLGLVTGFKGSSISIVFASALVAGCSSTDELSTSELVAKTMRSNGDGVLCKMEKPIGSHMKTRVCRSANEREELAESSQVYFQRHLKSGH